MLLVWGVLSNSALANDNRPLYIVVSQTSAMQYSVQWRLPPSLDLSQYPQVRLPYCQTLVSVLESELREASRSLASRQQKRNYLCTDGLGGREVKVEYPTATSGVIPKLATILRVTWLSGESQTVSVGVGELSIPIPAQETGAGVADEYFMLGVEHIWVGYDHLLFVACLIVIAGTFRKMLITITGFTLAHSMTLVLAALGWVSVPIQAVEASIALSIVFLACELVRNNRQTLTWRYPVAVSVSFGLLHGFGFAAVLQEIGLPQTELATALVAFNIGVEAGQVLFVLSVLTTLLLLRFFISRGISKALSAEKQVWQLGFYQLPVGYVVGGLASFWLIERLLVI